MEKIFHADKSRFSSSMEAVKEIFAKHFHIFDVEIEKTENGKPLLTNNAFPLFFSVSHTQSMLFIAFSDENVGIDAEPLSREVNFSLLSKKFPFEEREELISKQEFLRHWTVKESAIKWLDGTIAHDLKNLLFLKNQLFYKGLEIPVHVATHIIEGHILSICSARDFRLAETYKV